MPQTVCKPFLTAIMVLLGMFDVYVAVGPPLDEMDMVPLALGLIFAQLVLLAVWTALGPAGLFARFATGLAATTLLCVAIMANVAQDGVPWDMVLVVGGTIFSQWLAIQAPLWVIRLGFRWRLAWPDEQPAHTNTRETQFGIRQLFAWTALVAVVCGLVRFLLPEDAFGDDAPDVDWVIAVLLICTVFPALLAMPVVWATLKHENVGLWLLAAVGCFVVLCVAEAVVLMDLMPMVVNDEIPWALNAVQFVAATVVLLLARGCGFRLIQARSDT